VVLFVRPDREELQAAKCILECFGIASGLMVNYRKTTATIIRGTVEDGERVQEIMGCELAKFPIKYLGLQLALRPLKRAEWQSLIDQATHCLLVWQ
jgi:hypothetical protein